MIRLDQKARLPSSKTWLGELGRGMGIDELAFMVQIQRVGCVVVGMGVCDY